MCQCRTLRDKLINFQHRFSLPYDAAQPVASLTICLFSLFLLTYFVHRVATVVQIPHPWIRSDEREYRRQPWPHSPSFLCAIPNCVTTCEPAALRLSFLFSSSCFLSLTPHPHSPLPLSILTITTRHCHCCRLITSTCQHLTPTHWHLRFSRSSSAHSQIFGIAAFLPLPPSLVTWGTSPNLARRHHSALQR